ncbi:MAG: hypothetical protein KAU20_01285 [Nanoarchaeota archaeon]|nr:hypothetical protein [Nanoarchaeota archaeon]
MPKSRATPRTLKLLREWGWYYWGVEQHNAFSGRKTDLFHIIDYLVITNFSTIGVQSCAGDFAAHVKKLTEDELEHTLAWLRTPHRKLILIGWRKVLRKRGMKQRIYKPRIAWLYLDGDDLILEEKDTTSYGQK